MNEEKIIFRREGEFGDVIEVHDEGDHLKIGIYDGIYTRWGWQTLNFEEVNYLIRTLIFWRAGGFEANVSTTTVAMMLEHVLHKLNPKKHPLKRVWEL